MQMNKAIGLVLWRTMTVNVKNESAEAGESYGGRQTKRRIWFQPTNVDVNVLNMGNWCA